MKNLFKVILFSVATMFVLSSCSPFGIFSEGMSAEQSKYIEDAIVCDSKTKNYQIINQEDLEDFFDSGDYGKFEIEYEYKKTKNVNLKRTITITKVFVNGNAYYVVDFNRFVFPGSDCKKLQTKTKSY